MAILSYYVSLFLSLFASPTVLFVNDTTDHYHWGCTGTSTALKEEISDLGYRVDPVIIRQAALLKGVPESFDQFDDLAVFESFKKENPSFYRHLCKSKAVVINGEGSMHWDRPLLRALLYVAYVSKNFMGKHVEIINHSCYPEDTMEVSDEKLNRLYSEVYKKLDFVSVREPLSQQVMASIGISTSVSFDSLPIYIQKHYKNPKSHTEKNIVLAGSVAWEKEGIDAITKELKEYEKQGYKIKILIGAKASPAYDDKLFLEYVQNELKCDWEVVDAQSMDEWLDTINQADLLISGRFHHTIAAISLKTPFVVFNSNTPKIEGMLKVMPEKINVINYEDPNLEQKLHKQIEDSLQMKDQNFPTLDALCDLGKKKFEGLEQLKALDAGKVTTSDTEAFDATL